MYESLLVWDNPYAENRPALAVSESNHRSALGMLEYSILQRAAFTVITGRIGSGNHTGSKDSGSEEKMNIAH